MARAMLEETRYRVLVIVVAAALAFTAAGLVLHDGSSETAQHPVQAPTARELTLDADADIQLLGRFDSGDGDFTTGSSLGGEVALSAERVFRGSQAMLATASAADGFAYARVEESVAWDEGDEIWYGAAIFLERGFKDAQGEGSVDLMRWDNWPDHPEHTDHGGLAVLSDGTLALFREQLGSEPWTVILGPYSVPEGRWVWLEVRQRFSTQDGDAINEIWMDGRPLGGSEEANHFGRRITRHRIGIVATPDPQPAELRLFLDHAVVSKTGPVMRRQ